MFYKHFLGSIATLLPCFFPPDVPAERPKVAKDEVKRPVRPPARRVGLLVAVILWS